jgi:hypothetical protein
MVICGEGTCAEFLAWTVPDVDLDVNDPTTLCQAGTSARVMFSASNNGWWRSGTDTEILDNLLRRIPVDSVSTLTLQNQTQLSKSVWLHHAPRFARLKRVRLVPTAVRAFREMLEEDALPHGPPRLPRLKALILDKVALTALRTYHLRDMFIKRAEQGTPVQSLDVRTCFAAARAIEILSEVVRYVRGPRTTLAMGDRAFFNWDGSLSGGLFDEEDESDSEGGTDGEFDNGPSPWYGRVWDDDDSDEDEVDDDEEEDEDEDEEDNEDDDDAHADEH